MVYLFFCCTFYNFHIFASSFFTFIVCNFSAKKKATTTILNNNKQQTNCLLLVSSQIHSKSHTHTRERWLLMNYYVYRKTLQFKYYRIVGNIKAVSLAHHSKLL